MEIKTKFFGKINIADEQIIIFPYGIYGFENAGRFVLLHDEEDEENKENEEDENNTIFRWLQCIDDENLCFTVMEPEFICKGYNPKLPANAFNMLKKLGAGKELNGNNANTVNLNKDELIYLVIAVIYEDIEESTANLLGPIVINSKIKIGAQIILESSEPQNSEYKIKHKIFNSYNNNSDLFSEQAECEYKELYDVYDAYEDDQNMKIERMESIEKVTI